MTAKKAASYWTYMVLSLIVVIVIGSIISWSKYSRNQPIEISLMPTPEIQGKIYVGGAVNNPGYYPLKARDGIEDIINAAGGITPNADPTQLKLYIAEAGKEAPPQKVDLNRAEAWLLQALPGIGETRAKSIIEYRQQQGPFRNINELLKIEGVGTAIFEKIKHLITVAD